MHRSTRPHVLLWSTALLVTLCIVVRTVHAQTPSPPPGETQTSPEPSDLDLSGGSSGTPEASVLPAPGSTDSPAPGTATASPTQSSGSQPTTGNGLAPTQTQVHTVPVPSPSVTTETVTSPVTGLSVPSVDACLQQAVGADRLDRVFRGESVPAPRESRAARACFPSASYAYVAGTSALSADTVACLDERIGALRVQELLQESVLTSLDEVVQARSCFGIAHAPFAPTVTFMLPEPVRACVERAVPGDALAEILAGRREPTRGDQQSVAPCFQELAGLETTILPLPPTEVPFLTEDATTVSIARVETVSEEIAPGRFAPRVVFQGRAAPGTIVDLYLFSTNPVVVTLSTDANGVWTYRLDKDLTEGNHQAFAVVKLAQREPLRSPRFPFAVAEATASDAREDGLVATSTGAEPLRMYLLLAGVILAIGVITIFGFVIWRQRRRSSLSPPPATAATR